MRTLKDEFDWYLSHQDEIVARYDGQTIVIKEGVVLGAYPDTATAVSSTLSTHRLGSFLVQRVSPGDEAYTQRFHSRVYSSPARA